MADHEPRQSSIAPHRKNTLILPPPKLMFREVSVATDEGGAPIVDKWIYVFIEKSGELYAEIYAENEDLWRVEYKPEKKRKAVERFARTDGDITIDRKRLHNGDYLVFLSPVRASDDALALLKKHVGELTVAVALGTNSKGIPYAYVHDAFRAAEFQHEQYLFAYEKWTSYVSNRDRQARLFIAGTVDSWLADGDPANVGKFLQSREGPANVVKDYETSEKETRTEAEQTLVPALALMDSIEHGAIDLSAQQGGKKELAVGLLHWGIVSQNLLCVAPGRVYANKLMEENKALPAAVLLGDATPPNLYGAYATFKKAYEASAYTVLHLLAARIKQLRKSAGGARGVNEKIILYLRKLGLETELKGNYKRIQERLEAGDKITKRLKGTQRSSVIRSYEKLVQKAGTQIPDYGKDAQTVVDTADRLHAKHLNAEAAASFAQVLFYAISLMDAIEDFRNAFPEDKDKQIIAIAGVGGDVYKSAAELAEKLGASGVFLKVTGGVAGLVSGIVDMLDAEDKALNAAMNNKAYSAAVGHSITVVGASMTAFSGGLLLAEGIAVLLGHGVAEGALLGGPFGAIVGAIGAGLMALGMLVVAFFSKNEYQTFARHCFLGEKSDTSVDPDWATVSFGGGVIINEFYALYDLIYRYKVNFLTVARIIPGLPDSRDEWSAVKLIIHPQYGFGSDSRYHVDVAMVHDLPQIESKFEVKGLVLPDAQTATNADGKLTTLVRRWNADEVVNNMLAQKPKPKAGPGLPQHLHWYTGRFTLTVQLTVGGMAVGKPTKLSGKIGGTSDKPISSPWGQRDFEEHH